MQKMIPMISILLGVLFTLSVYVWNHTKQSKNAAAFENIHLFNHAQTIPEFELIDENNQTVTNEWLNGKWTIINLGYTFCPDICPTNLADTSIMMRILAEQSIDAQFIQSWFVTIDPQRDSIAVIKQYTQAFHADLLGITGVETDINEFAARFGFSYQVQKQQENNDYYLVAHSDMMILINPKGQYAGYILPPYDSQNMAFVLSKLIEGAGLN
ncbi:SCO family protein [Marinicellulosiphila megalodicopiae]|uniref:SCO family protein n=1 Tax=Marinicellulosiphila megalodicopiae TaxID=2724896 RepID=UPI003BB11DFA